VPNWVIIVGGVLGLGGLAVTMCSILMAKEGFEDEDGFHSPPQPTRENEEFAHLAKRQR